MAIEEAMAGEAIDAVITLRMAQLGLWAGSLGRRKGTWEIGPWKRRLKFLHRDISEDVLS